ncbi:MAG: N-acetylmuramoyl-L-alanine amidase [Elusimicrobia bacterium]|nr:N-acetylmuramoyl-L-alanine amidase [Elusimicrobiota bacterium]
MSAAAILLSSLLAAPFGIANGEEIAVSLGGKSRDSLSTYRVGEAVYLSAKEAGELYGGQVYWYPVSGRVQMSFRGQPLQFLVDSDEVRLGENKVKMDASVMLRTSAAFIPLAFFLSEEFSAFAGMDSTYNPRTKFLSVEKRSSVGSVRWFSYKDTTRLTVELDERLSYKPAARGVGGLEVSIPFGTVSSAEAAQIDDGVVEYFTLKQQSNAAKLSVKLADPKVHWRLKELGDPRRLVIDVYLGDAPSVPKDEPRRETRSEPPAKAKAETAAPPAPEPSAPAASAGPVILGAGSDKVKRRIVVDAGHGGKDPGATGRSGTQEKDVNLSAAQELAKLLKQEGTFEVMLTRADDTFVPLADRSRLANEFGADLFISLHCNASHTHRDSGFEVYFLSEKASDPEAQKLADFENSVVELEGKSVQDEQAAVILGELSKTENINAASEWAALLARDLSRRVDVENRGVKQAGFYVLRGTHAPAVLFEMAYLTNKGDEAKLESKKYRRRIVDGIYAGILDYAKREGWVAAPR